MGESGVVGVVERVLRTGIGPSTSADNAIAVRSHLDLADKTDV